MQAYSTYQNTALLILRIIIAAIFLVAGYSKIPFWSGAPEGLSAFMLFVTRLLSIVEPLGALAVLTGFLTRWAACGLSIIMIGAIYVTKFLFGTGFIAPTSAGWNFPLVILGGCIILVAFGAGSWSIDSNKARGSREIQILQNG